MFNGWVKPVSNPPNPWLSTHVEYLDEEPPPLAALEIYEEEAKSILSENDSPDLGFRWSLNPYRGCFHSCAYCSWGGTAVTMADGSVRAIRDLRAGERILGTEDDRLVVTEVRAHWSTRKRAVRVRLSGGGELVTSADHRFLTDGGWKHVGDDLSTSDRLRGPNQDRRVTAIEPLGVDLPMYDITTGTGDFIANGVISHNCYARPSHQYLGWGAGTDFDRKIVVKTNAAALLREALMKKSWAGETIMFSGITDCYQPVEASYGITRACLEVCEEFANPVGVITKSKVIQRDVDLFGRLARKTRTSATLSIPFARDEMARKIEPFASPPSRRFETLKMLSDAGVRTGIAIAPVIPGLNDPDIPELLERAREVGATHAFMTLLRLPLEVRPVFQERIRETLTPERVRRIEHAVVELRGGGIGRSPDGSRKMNESRFFDRFVGQGERWKAIEALFDIHYRRLGFDDGDDAPQPTTFRRPKNQLDLF